jgi:hypothetical protein
MTEAIFLLYVHKHEYSNLYDTVMDVWKIRKPVLNEVTSGTGLCIFMSHFKVPVKTRHSLFNKISSDRGRKLCIYICLKIFMLF